jgi:hypothetical protein
VLDRGAKSRRAALRWLLPGRTEDDDFAPDERGLLEDRSGGIACADAAS